MVLKLWKVNLRQAGTLQLTGIRRNDGELLCVRDAGADGQWIFVAVDVDDFFSLITFY